MNNDSIPLWEHVHGATSHFPIAMVFVSFAFDLGALLFKRPHWRIVAFWALMVGAIISVFTILSGLTGANGWFHVDAYTSPTMIKHRNIALISGSATILLALWRTFSIERKHYRHIADLDRDMSTVAPTGEYIAYLVLMAFATAGIGYAGYLGAYVAQGT